MDNEKDISIKTIQDKIVTVRGLQVMLDCDLAEMFRVEVKKLNV